MELTGKPGPDPGTVTWDAGMPISAITSRPNAFLCLVSELKSRSLISDFTKPIMANRFVRSSMNFINYRALGRSVDAGKSHESSQVH